MTPAALKALMGGDMENFVAATTEGGIEAQERRGQIEQSFRETLPKDGTVKDGFCRKNCRVVWEALGFVFKTDADDIFINVSFPKGWRKQATDHAMWSKLLDDEGRERAMIFYKAAFYDRSAHVTLSCRYSMTAYGETGKKDIYRVIITDFGKEIKSFGEYACGDYKASGPLKSEALAYLMEHYPLYEDASAYWD